MQSEYVLRRSGNFEPAEPLYKRVPTRDAQGRLLNDLMMIIPGLKSPPGHRQLLRDIERILLGYHEHVVFAEVNMRLGTLWVSLRQTAGIGVEIAAALHHSIPQARLVAQQTAPA